MCRKGDCSGEQDEATPQEPRKQGMELFKTSESGRAEGLPSSQGWKKNHVAAKGGSRGLVGLGLVPFSPCLMPMKDPDKPKSSGGSACGFPTPRPLHSYEQWDQGPISCASHFKISVNTTSITSDNRVSVFL